MAYILNDNDFKEMAELEEYLMDLIESEEIYTDYDDKLTKMDLLKDMAPHIAISTM